MLPAVVTDGGIPVNFPNIASIIPIPGIIPCVICSGIVNPFKRHIQDCDGGIISPPVPDDFRGGVRNVISRYVYQRIVDRNIGSIQNQ